MTACFDFLNFALRTRLEKHPPFRPKETVSAEEKDLDEGITECVQVATFSCFLSEYLMNLYFCYIVVLFCVTACFSFLNFAFGARLEEAADLFRPKETV